VSAEIMAFAVSVDYSVIQNVTVEE